MRKFYATVCGDDLIFKNYFKISKQKRLDVTNNLKGFFFIQVHEKNKIQAFLDSCESNTDRLQYPAASLNIFCGIKSLMFLKNYSCSLAMVRYSS